MARRDPIADAQAALREYALAFPGSTEDHPWGEIAIKIKGKVFVFLSRPPEKFNVTTKLPISGPSALKQPFAEATGYGLGKHGWVTASFAESDAIPLDLLRDWIDESFRAVAPKSVLAKMQKTKSDEIVIHVRPRRRRK